MSQCTFIAANVPLAEVRSPHYSTFSINEAPAAGTALDADILGCGIDPDEPDVVLACGLASGKDPADNFSLLEFPFARCYCDMDLAVSIELGGLGPADMTPEKAARIADYVREVLTRTDAVELWTVWLSEYDPPRIKERLVAASAFTGADVEEIYSASCWPTDDIVNLYGGERPTYHCLSVER